MTSRDFQIHSLPPEWQFTPLGKDGNLELSKIPYTTEWQKTDIPRGEIERAIDGGDATGFGLRLGAPSGDVVSIDLDGPSAIALGLEQFGELPITVSWTSGKPGRYQALFVVPNEYRDLVRNKKLLTGIVGADGKDEQIEFRYTGNQSALPPSAHPETEGYIWINSPESTPVAELPKVVIDYWLDRLNPPKPERKAVSKTSTKVSEGDSITGITIPIVRLLAQAHRKALDGVLDGSRNHTAIKLACDLIGVESLGSIECDYKGKIYILEIERNGREMFSDYCNGCTPPLESGVEESTWNSALSRDGNPSIQNEEALIMCARSYLKEVIGSNPMTEEDAADLKVSIKNAHDLQNCKAPNLFGGVMGKLLMEAALNFNTPVAVLNFISLPVLASQIDSRTKLLINPGTDYSVPAVRWCAVVGETGTRKTPVIKLITKALRRIQGKVAEIYQAELSTYETEYSNWKSQKPEDKGEPPIPPSPMLDVFFSNFTIEALVDSIRHYPNKGYLLLLDELAQFYKSLDMYRGGKGSDRQQWLTIWDAGAIKNNRKSSGSVFIPQAAISIVGGIQPQTIRNMIVSDDSDLDGFWHRLSLVGLPDTTIDPFTTVTGDLAKELERIYKVLSEQSNQDYALSDEAKELWSVWHYEMESKRKSTDREMLKGVYPKFEGICGRNALILHCTYAAIEDKPPARFITESTMRTAIEWTKWELSQTLLQYQDLGVTEDPESVRIRKFIDKFSGDEWWKDSAEGWVSADNCRASWSTKPKPNASDARKFMSKVVYLGHAIGNGEKVDSGKYRIQITRKSGRSGRRIDETLTETDIQHRPLMVEEVVEVSHNIKTDSTLGNSSTTSTIDGRKSGREFGRSSVADDIDMVETNDDEKTSTTSSTIDGRSIDPSVDGHHSDSDQENFDHQWSKLDSLPEADRSDSSTTSTTFPSNLEKKIEIGSLEEGDDDDLN